MADYLARGSTAWMANFEDEAQDDLYYARTRKVHDDDADTAWWLARCQREISQGSASSFSSSLRLVFNVHPLPNPLFFFFLFLPFSLFPLLLLFLSFSPGVDIEKLRELVSARTGVLLLFSPIIFNGAVLFLFFFFFCDGSFFMQIHVSFFLSFFFRVQSLSGISLKLIIELLGIIIVEIAI